MIRTKKPRAKTIILRPIEPSATVETAFLSSLNQLVRKIIAPARQFAAPVAVELGKRFGDDVGANARSVIEELRRVAAQAQAEAERQARAAIDAEGARHTRKWKASVASQAQIDLSYLLRDDDLVDLLSVRSEEFNRLIRNLSNDVLDRIERETIRAVFEGRGNDEIAKSLREIEGIGRNRARLIARDQASKLNAAQNEFRQRQAEVTHYKWRTILDGRERASHHANNGKVFAWDKPPPTSHPGVAVNCRCRSLAILTDAPEELGPDADADLGDWFVDNLPLVREVATIPKEPVFGLGLDAIEAWIASTLDLGGKINLAKASSAFTLDDAERLVVELYGYKPTDEVLAGLLPGLIGRLATRRARLFAAVSARLDMISNVLAQARAGASSR